MSSASWPCCGRYVLNYDTIKWSPIKRSIEVGEGEGEKEERAEVKYGLLQSYLLYTYILFYYDPVRRDEAFIDQDSMGVPASSPMRSTETIPILL